MSLPNLFDAVEVDNNGERLVLEVQQHIGNNWVRCLALGATDGLARGVTMVNDTGSKRVGSGRPGNAGAAVRRDRHSP